MKAYEFDATMDLYAQIDALKADNAHLRHRMNLYWDSYQSCLKTVIELRKKQGPIRVRMVGRNQMGATTCGRY